MISLSFYLIAFGVEVSRALTIPLSQNFPELKGQRLEMVLGYLYL